MQSQLIDKFQKNILYIKDKQTDSTVDLNTVEIVFEAHKYSNTKKAIYKFRINNQIISRNNNYKICYQCIECQRESIINLNGFVKKLNKNITKCQTCKELDLNKRAAQSEFMFMREANYKPKEKKPVSELLDAVSGKV